MKIFIDTNVINDDFLLQQPQIRVLEHYLSKASKTELCIPEVVFEEMKRHFRKAYQDAVNRYKKDEQILTLAEVKSNELPDIEAATKNYRIQLENRLKALNARINPTPSVELRKLLFRALDKKKPFESSGRGFKDSVLWETILNECRIHVEKIVIITNDSDFGDRQSDPNNVKLYDDLIDDLHELEQARDRVEIYSSIRTFNEKYSLPIIGKIYRQGESVEGTIAEKLDPIGILNSYTPHLKTASFEKLPSFLGLPFSKISKLSIIQWPEQPSIIEAVDLENNEVQVLLSAHAVVDAEFIMNDLEEYTHMLRIALFQMSNISWNEEGKLQVEFRLQVFPHVLTIWNTKLKSALSFELVHVGFKQSDFEWKGTTLPST